MNQHKGSDIRITVMLIEQASLSLHSLTCVVQKGGDSDTLDV